MNKTTLLLVRDSAELLISKIDTVLALSEEEIQARARHNTNPNKFFTYTDNPDYLVSGVKQTSSLKRASMDLTRSLADLRQNR